jgi:hypothetical protein
MLRRYEKIHLENEIDPEPEKNKSKNLFFASKHFFSGNKMSRRDDIIEIMYNLIYLANPIELKMAKIFLKSQNVFKEMAEYKLNA